MRKQLAILAVAAVLSGAALARADTYMPTDAEAQPGMSMADRQGATPDMESSETVTVEVVEIDGDRLIAEMDSGEHLVFLIEESAGLLNVGDELELKLDGDAKTAVILNVLPHEQRHDS